MKSHLKIILITLIIILLAQIALADIIVDNNDLTIKANYEGLNNKDNFAQFNGHQLTITNTGSSTENITLQINNLNTKYQNFILDLTNFELNAGESRVVTLSGETPIDLDQGLYNNVADLKITTDSGIDNTNLLNVNVQSMLNIDKIYVYVNGKKEETVNQDGEEVNNLKPGDEIELRFRLENIFREDYNEGDIFGNIFLVLDDNNFAGDIDEEQDFDIESGFRIRNSDDEIVLKFTIPLKAEKDTYPLEITIESEDQNNVQYKTNWILNLEVKRERDDVRVEYIELSPSTIDCNREIEVNVKMINVGTKTQRNAVLEILSKELGLEQKFESRLERGTSNKNDLVESFKFTIDKNVVPEIYDIIATSYYDYNIFGDKQTAKLTIKECSNPINNDINTNTQTSLTNNPQTENVVKNNVDNSANLITSSEIVATVEESYSKDDLFIGLMIVAVFLMFGMMVLFIVILLKK